MTPVLWILAIAFALLAAVLVGYGVAKRKYEEKPEWPTPYPRERKEEEDV